MSKTLRWTGCGAALCLVALCAAPGAQAQRSNFGTIALRTGFTPDPQVARGTSGGSVQASTLGSSCTGWIARTPDHILNLQTSFRWLRIFAESGADTTLVIRTPGGQTLCDDDTFETDPAIEQGFAAGTYQIWIGSYSQGENAAYQLKLTELRSVRPGGGSGAAAQAAAQPSADHSTRACGTSMRGQPVCVDANAARPNFGCHRNRRGCRVRTGFTPDPWQFHLTAGGGRDPINVQTLNLHDAADHSACGRSFITPQPDFRFYFESGTSFDLLRFYVITQNGSDATLLVNQPDATWRCNDDSHGGLMPTIDFDHPQPGRYDVWVGTYDGSTRNPATFHVTELESNHP